MDLLPDLERDVHFCQMTDHAPRCLPERDGRQKKKNKKCVQTMSDENSFLKIDRNSQN